MIIFHGTIHNEQASMDGQHQNKIMWNISDALQGYYYALNEVQTVKSVI